MIALWLALGCTGEPPVVWRLHGQEGALPEVPWVGQDTGAPEVDLPPVVINEAMSDNDSVVMTPYGEFVDWVELYNAGEEPVALSRLELQDGSGATWRGGDGRLEPGAFLVIWADEGDGADHAPFKLSSDGDALTLLIDGHLADQLDLPALLGDTSRGRFPDGGAVATTIWPTPGWTNGSAPGDSQDPSDVLFQTSVVWDAYLEIGASSWASLEADAYTEVPASFSFLGANFPKVNVRRKGVYGSLRSMDDKAAFKVDLDDYEDHMLRGVDDLTINNMVQDPSCVAELLTYEVFRAAGLPAPRVGYVRLHVNGELWGLYALIESVDEDFLKRWYADPDGPLYEGAYGVDFYTGWESLFEYDEGPDKNDRADLTELAVALQADPADPAAYAHLRTLFDMDQFHLYKAMEALTWHWDGYTTANNYRVYHDPSTDLFTMIPWGTDQTWIDEWYRPYDGGGVLFTWCLANTTCRAEYDLALLRAADIAEGAALEPLMDDTLALIDPHIAVDPRREFTDGDHSAWVSDVRGNLLEGPDRLRAAVP